MRSVDVVFPASMCAIMPMLRVSSSLKPRPAACCDFSLVSVAITGSFSSVPPLPAIMRERLVRYCHAVHVFLFLDGPAARICSVNQLVRQLVNHGLAGAIPRILQQPADRQRLPPE